MATFSKTLLPLLVFLLVLSNKVVSQGTPTTFTFDSFSTSKDKLIYQGDAFVPSSSSFARLTKMTSSGHPAANSTGRLVYAPPVHLWDEGMQATFETTIKFTITSVNYFPGSGLAFFIAPIDSPIPANSINGNFGLFDPDTGLAPSLFAVEFDIVSNTWDPSYRHIGIDINSRVSKNVSRLNYTVVGQQVTARINYVSSTRTISVVATYGSENSTVSHVFDLKTVLPKHVQVGISSATGSWLAFHDINAWYFSSSLVWDGDSALVDETFTFDSFSTSTDRLIYQGDAFVPSSSSFARLTKMTSFGGPATNSIGRLVYAQPVTLWDEGMQATFETTIKFTITPVDNIPGAGLAFFIAPVDSLIPIDSINGNFGLFDPDTALAPSLFAVEFDIASNTWDPSYRHIGIDINSRVSKNVSRFDHLVGQEVTARINYVSSTRTISVVATYGSENSTVSHVFDLKTVLPKQVQVGISSATGSWFAFHDINAWYFSSSLVWDGNSQLIRQYV